MAKKLYYFDKARRQGKTIDDFLKLYLKSERPGRNTSNISLNEIRFDDSSKFTNYLLEFSKNKTKVAVIGDYDVDGITSTAIIGKTLNYLGIPNELILPNRFTNGYGLSKMLVDDALRLDCKAIITVDNGIVAFEATEYAKQMGMTVLVTDHHKPSVDGNLPKADLIIAPTLKRDNIKASNICGAFTAFVLCRDVLRRVKANDVLIHILAELAGIATLADQMDLEYENLKITKWLLYRFHTFRFKNVGIKLLAQIMFVKLEKCSEEDLLFNIIPALNATGRMESAMIALELLMEEDSKKLIPLISRIKFLNEYRKKYSRKYANVLLQRLDPRDVNANVCVLDKTKFDKDIDIDLSGIVGIIASNIVENTNKPSFVFFKNDKGIYHGSGRTIEGFDLFNFVNSRKDKFNCVKMGGHTGAMGITLATRDDVIAFKRALNDVKIELPDATKSYIMLKDSMDFDVIADAVERFGPYGPTYQKPAFALDINVKEAFTFASIHTQFNVKCFGKNYLCVFFFDNDKERYLNQPARMYFTFAKSGDQVQLFVESIDV